MLMLSGWISGIVGVAIVWNTIWQPRSELCELNDYNLKDVGLRRDEIRASCPQEQCSCFDDLQW